MKHLCFLFVFFIVNLQYLLFAQNTPQRIVSLGPAVSRQLSLLGVEDKIVGVTRYCKIPKEIIGTVIKAHIEKIVMLRPHLVIATPLTNPKDIQKLKALGINVIIFEEAKSFLELCEQFLKMARIVEREEFAKEILEIAKKRISSIQKKLKDLSRPTVIVQIGARPLWVATRDSFINDFIELAGGVNIGPPGRSGLVSREYVVRGSPHVIIIVAMGFKGEEEKRRWKRFKTIEAVKNKRIYIVDPYELCSPTPASFPQTVEEISKLLHPDRK